MSNDNATDNVTPLPVTPLPVTLEVAKVVYTSRRQTKLGLAVVTIRQECDLIESTVTISYGKINNEQVFKAEGIFADAREAFMWAYGVKQTRNDRYAGYTVKDDILIETKPSKNKVAYKLTVTEALIESQIDYDNFTLSQSKSTLDKVSISAVKASTLLSDEDKAVMANLFAKMGKVVS